MYKLELSVLAAVEHVHFPEHQTNWITIGEAKVDPVGNPFETGEDFAHTLHKDFAVLVPRFELV